MTMETVRVQCLKHHDLNDECQLCGQHTNYIEGKGFFAKSIMRNFFCVEHYHERTIQTGSDKTNEWYPW